MLPTFFPESNTVMTRPAGMTAEECHDVHAFTNGIQVITAWKPSPAELVKINMGAPVYLILWGGMQPSLVTADSPFLENDR